MKRLFVCAVIILAVCASAYGDPMPGFYVGNIRYIFGGNSDAYINIDDYTSIKNLKTYDFQGGAVELQPRGRGVRKPISSGRVPSAKDGLLNPGKPIEITASGESIVFAFDRDQYIGLKLRIFDSSGKLLGSVPDERSRYVLKVQSSPKNYYVEVNDNGYCYFLLSVKSGPEFVRYVPSKKEMDQAKKEAAVYQEVMEAYMKQHGIKDRSDLKAMDMMSISTEVQERLYGKEEAQYMAEGQAAIRAYMQKHGIKNFEDMTENDMKALQDEMMKAHQNEINSQKAAPAKTKKPVKRKTKK